MNQQQHNFHSHECGCLASGGDSSFTQTLEELGFERGIWGSISAGDRKRVESLLRNNKKWANAIDPSGYYPIHYASRDDSLIDIVEMLIDYDAKINVKTNGGATPLHRSSFCGALKITKLYLSKDKERNFIDHQDSDGMTPLHKAYQADRKEIIDLLLKYNADQNIKDKFGKIPKDYLVL
eukprot:gene7580-9321_t